MLNLEFYVTYQFGLPWSKSPSSHVWRPKKHWWIQRLELGFRWIDKLVTTSLNLLSGQAIELIIGKYSVVPLIPLLDAKMLVTLTFGKSKCIVCIRGCNPRTRLPQLSISCQNNISYFVFMNSIQVGMTGQKCHQGWQWRRYLRQGALSLQSQACVSQSPCSITVNPRLGDPRRARASACISDTTPSARRRFFHWHDGKLEFITTTGVGESLNPNPKQACQQPLEGLGWMGVPSC